MRNFELISRPRPSEPRGVSEEREKKKRKEGEKISQNIISARAAVKSTSALFITARSRALAFISRNAYIRIRPKARTSASDSVRASAEL